MLQDYVTVRRDCYETIMRLLWLLLDSYETVMRLLRDYYEAACETITKLLTRLLRSCYETITRLLRGLVWLQWWNNSLQMSANYAIHFLIDYSQPDDYAIRKFKMQKDFGKSFRRVTCWFKWFRISIRRR